MLFLKDAVLDHRQITSGVAGDFILKKILRGPANGHFKNVVRYDEPSMRLIIETSTHGDLFRKYKNADDSEGKKQVISYSTCARNVS
jgi:hypothetical protein